MFYFVKLEKRPSPRKYGNKTTDLNKQTTLPLNKQTTHLLYTLYNWRMHACNWSVCETFFHTLSSANHSIKLTFVRKSRIVLNRAHIRLGFGTHKMVDRIHNHACNAIACTHVRLKVVCIEFLNVFPSWVQENPYKQNHYHSLFGLLNVDRNFEVATHAITWRLFDVICKSSILISKLKLQL